MPDWSTSSIISSILSLKVCFLNCCFRWVKREINSVAYAAAKFSLVSSESFCFNKDNLPIDIQSACLGDSLHVLLV